MQIMVLLQGGSSTLVSSHKNTLWMILESEESSAQPPTPPPVLGTGCTRAGLDCKDCRCQVVFIQCKGKHFSI